MLKPDMSDMSEVAASTMLSDAIGHLIERFGSLDTLRDKTQAIPRAVEIHGHLQQALRLFEPSFPRSKDQQAPATVACHKLNPSGAQGAVSAMHDAIALANLIYALPLRSHASDIEKMFSEYQTERLVHVTESFNNSKAISTVMERGLVGTIALFIQTHFPSRLMTIMIRRQILNRPQAGFLETIPLKGSVPAIVSPSTEKARAVHEQRTATPI
ncbi:hypothetical protein EC957_008829 [Mortierella hygrophila]|uniref:Uncharacterized protein n=1 Tax=Mortierella hygrophila TaxID=979708 RepID=A0A9P6FAY9_9FUNG|nr:hypothetical protein EC957_008829 [Mortierella hygrophila]